MEKNKNIAFHGGNPAAVEVYNRVRYRTRMKSDELQRPYYMWETIKEALDALEEKNNTPRVMTLLELLEATKKLEGLDEVEIDALDAAIEKCKTKTI